MNFKSNHIIVQNKLTKLSDKTNWYKLTLWIPKWKPWLCPAPEKVIGFLPASKSTFLVYSQHQEKLRNFLKKLRLGSSLPLDIIIIGANQIMHPSLLQKSANLTLILCFWEALLPAVLLHFLESWLCPVLFNIRPVLETWNLVNIRDSIQIVLKHELCCSHICTGLVSNKYCTPQKTIHKCFGTMFYWAFTFRGCSSILLLLWGEGLTRAQIWSRY